MATFTGLTWHNWDLKSFNTSQLLHVIHQSGFHALET